MIQQHVQPVVGIGIICFGILPKGETPRLQKILSKGCLKFIMIKVIIEITAYQLRFFI